MCSLAGPAPAGQKAELQVANLLQFAVLNPSEVAAFAVANELTVVATVAETVAAYAAFAVIVAASVAASAASQPASAGCRSLTAAGAVRHLAAATLTAVEAMKHVAAAVHAIALQKVVERCCFLQGKLELQQL